MLLKQIHTVQVYEVMVLYLIKHVTEFQVIGSFTKGYILNVFIKLVVVR